MTDSFKQDYLDDDAAVDLHAKMERVVIEWLGLQPPLSGPFAQKLLDGMRSEMGGQRVYIPATRRKQEQQEAISNRDSQIAKMFNGRNVRDVMRAFGVSRRTVYNALKRTRCK